VLRGGTEATGLDARGDILLALKCGMSVVDVSITHTSEVANRRAAKTDGAAAAQRDREKRRTYGQLEPTGHPFIPFSVETYGRLDKPAISSLGQLGLEAKEAGCKASKSGFVAPIYVVLHQNSHDVASVVPPGGAYPDRTQKVRATRGNPD
jgi:hypothetical protein